MAHRRIGRVVAALAATCTLVVTTAGGGEAQVPPPAPVGPGVSLERPASMTPALAAVSTPALADGTAVAQARAAGVPADGPGSLLRHPDGRLIVEVHLAEGTDAAAAALPGAGAEVVATGDNPHLVTVAIDPAGVPALAALPAVDYVADIPAPFVASAGGVRRPRSTDEPALLSCSLGVISEGDLVLDADLARATFGADGSTVDVGVLSDSFDNLGGAAGDVTAGELPGIGNPCGRTRPVRVQSELGSGGGSDEGRAMAQIVHDLTPNASLSVATVLAGEQDYANQIRAMGQAGADVITDDITYALEPMFQDGPVAAAINENRTLRGISHYTVTSNANLVLGGKDVGGYEAPAFRPATCPAPLPAVDFPACHDFAPGAGVDTGNSMTLAPGGEVTLSLGWNEPMAGVGTDLDLVIVDKSSATVVTSSLRDNTGAAGKPTEFVRFTNDTGTTRTYDVVIARFHSSPTPNGTPRLRTVTDTASGVVGVERDASFGGDVVGPTLKGHSAAASAMSTATVNYFSPGVPADYSSRGPATICWQPASGSTPAAPFNPCRTVDPDLTAVDGTQTSFFGQWSGSAWRFYGTSAAAPHAAAVAALAHDHAWCATTDQVEAALRATARPVGSAGPSVVGSGLIDADAALAALPDCGPPPRCGPSAPAGPLWDVAPTHVFCDDIAWLLDAAITSGYADGSFQPSRSVRRQEMAAFLFRFGQGGTPPGCTTAPFADVSATSPFCGYVTWLVDQGITTGRADGTFGAAGTVDRGAMAAFMRRLAQPGVPVTPCTTRPFPDVAVTHPFCGDIAWLVTTGVTTGYPDGTFKPATVVQRSTMAAFLRRLDTHLAG